MGNMVYNPIVVTPDVEQQPNRDFGTEGRAEPYRSHELVMGESGFPDCPTPTSQPRVPYMPKDFAEEAVGVRENAMQHFFQFVIPT